MNITGILTGVISGTMILAACTPKNPADTVTTTTNPTGATMTGSTGGDGTESDSGTTGSGSMSGTEGTSGPTSDPTSDSDTTEGGTTGCSFIDCNDGGGGTGPQCDIWAQDCPEEEKCMPWANDGGSSWNATKCTPLDPAPQQPGDVCSTEGGGVSGVDNCAKSSMCWNVDPETNEGTCVAFCEGSEEDPMCAPGFGCTIANMGTLILCLPKCDPLVQDCGNGDLCLPQPGGGDLFICVLDASGEVGAYGDPCEFENACDPGFLCINPEYVEGCQAGGCCTPFCDITEMPDQCPGDSQECIPWYDMDAPPEYENVGVCGIPQ